MDWQKIVYKNVKYITLNTKVFEEYLQQIIHIFLRIQHKATTDLHSLYMKYIWTYILFDIYIYDIYIYIPYSKLTLK